MHDIENPENEINNINLGWSLSFDSGIAKACGVNAAIVYNHILYWLGINVRNPRCLVNDKIWMYEAIPKMQEFLDFLSEKEIRNSLDILVKNNLIIKENFNSNKFDRTSWYTITNQYLIKNFKKVNSMRPYGQMDEPPRADGTAPTGGCIYKEEIRIRNKNKKDNTAQTSHPTSLARGSESEIFFSFEFEEFKNITQKDLDAWKDLYPTVDIDREIKAMQQWCLAEPTKSKSKSKWRKFITNWLSRDNDKNINLDASKKSYSIFPPKPPKKEEWAEINRKFAEELIRKNRDIVPFLSNDCYYANNLKNHKCIDFRLIEPSRLKAELERLGGVNGLRE